MHSPRIEKYRCLCSFVQLYLLFHNGLIIALDVDSKIYDGIGTLPFCNYRVRAAYSAQI